MRGSRFLLPVLVVGLLAVPAAPASAQPVPGGPLVLMGIDAEDCGPDGHGPITVYDSVVNDIMSKTTKAGTGILVLGGEKEADDCTGSFWDQISLDTGHPVTYVNTGPGIAGANFAPFKMLAVVSDENNTFGGLTQEEHDALAVRKNDVAAFVNSGGGLLGFSSNFDAANSTVGAGPYEYLAVVGSFTTRIDLSYADIAPTADGMAIGINDSLDVCCWHNTFPAFPPFLKVLATDNEAGEDGFGEAAALGGAQVFVGVAPPAGPNKCPGYEDVPGRHFVGTPGNDVLVPPSPDYDVICGLGGKDFIRGKFQDDILDGGKGNDVVRGGNQRDIVKGGAGQDKLKGRRGNDTLIGGKGFDILLGGFGEDVLRGGPKNDHCEGGRGLNALVSC